MHLSVYLQMASLQEVQLVSGTFRLITQRLRHRAPLEKKKPSNIQGKVQLSVNRRVQMLVCVPWLVLASTRCKIPNFENHFSSFGQASAKPTILRKKKKKKKKKLETFGTNAWSCGKGAEIARTNATGCNLVLNITRICLR